VACVLTEDAAGCYNVVALANRRWPSPWAFSARAFTRSDRRPPRHLRHAGRWERVSGGGARPAGGLVHDRGVPLVGASSPEIRRGGARNGV